MGKTQPMYVTSGLLALIAFLVGWLVFGSLLVGIVLALIVLLAFGGGTYVRR